MRQLFGGLARDEFLGRYWETVPLLAPAAISTANLPLGLSDVEPLLRPGRTPVVSIVTDGLARPLSAEAAPDAALTAYAAGSTLLVPRLQGDAPALAELCRELDLAVLTAGVPLVEAVSANGYLSPPHAQGFGIHYDNHCAFVLHLHGAKKWQVFAPRAELPLDRCERPLERDDLGTPLIDATLRPGDMLYLPRGFPHVAGTTERSSLHVTLSLRTLTWADAIAELSRSRPELRRSLPVPGTVADCWHGTVRSALGDLDVDDYRRRRLGRSLAALAPVAGGRLAAIDAAPDIRADSQVRRASQMTCLTGTEDGQAVLRFPGSTLTLPAVMQPVFDFVAVTSTFRPAALPEVGPEYDRVGLTRLMMVRGLLEPAGEEVRVAGATTQPATTQSATTQPATTQPAVTGVRSALAPQRPAATPAKRDLTLVRAGGPTATPHLDWLYTRARLTPAECDHVIDTCRGFEESAAATVDQHGHPDRWRVSSRSIALTADTRWFLELIRDVAAEASRSHYRLKLTGIVRPPCYLEYTAGYGRFDRHNDYSHDQAEAPRKLTVIVQLSEPADYDGGRLLMHGLDNEELPCERGSILVFPAFIYHQVTPVTRGIRRSLVSWVGGPRLC